MKENADFYVGLASIVIGAMTLGITGPEAIKQSDQRYYATSTIIKENAQGTYGSLDGLAIVSIASAELMVAGLYILASSDEEESL